MCGGGAKKKVVVLIDLSGTLHVADAPTPRAVEALKALRENSRRFSLRFVTNTTKESSANLHSRLRRCGFADIQRAEIFSSLSAARRLISERGLRPFLFLEPEAMDDFRDVAASGGEPPNAVLVGLAPTKFDFGTLNAAFRILLASDHPTPLIAVHKGRYHKSAEEGEGLCLGPGPFVECLEFATGRKAEIVGKPEAEFFRQAAAAAGGDAPVEFSSTPGADRATAPTSPSSPTTSVCVMIGDDVRDDCVGAIRAGMQAILVRTGKYRPGDENEIPAESRICVENFYEAVQFLLAKFQ